jgi:predicted transcriptional regulator
MSPKQRRQTIRENILHMTTEKIAVKCGVCKRTILRDIKAWKQEGGFTELLYDEFIKSYPTQKESFPEKTFDRLVYLLGKTFTVKRETKTQKTILSKHVEELNVNLATYESAVQKVVARHIPANSS